MVEVPDEYHGDRFWEATAYYTGKKVAGPHRLKKYKSPDHLWKTSCRYFAWVQEHPLREHKVFHNQGEITETYVYKARAMTLKGLRLFLGISNDVWRRYSQDPDYEEICEVIEDIIYTQKFEGAAADLFNANLIARDLGLSEKNEYSGRNGGPVAIEVTAVRELLVSRLDRIAARESTE